MFVCLSVSQKKIPGWLAIDFRLGQWPKNQKGKTAHTDPQFKHTLETFNGTQMMIQKDNVYNDNNKYRPNAEGIDE